MAAAPAMGGGAGALGALLLRGGPLMSPPAFGFCAGSIAYHVLFVVIATYQWLGVDI